MPSKNPLELDHGQAQEREDFHGKCCLSGSAPSAISHSLGLTCQPRCGTGKVRSQVLAKLAEKLIVSSADAILADKYWARLKRSASPTNTAFLAAFGLF